MDSRVAASRGRKSRHDDHGLLSFSPLYGGLKTKRRHDDNSSFCMLFGLQSKDEPLSLLFSFCYVSTIQLSKFPCLWDFLWVKVGFDLISWHDDHSSWFRIFEETIWSVIQYDLLHLHVAFWSLVQQATRPQWMCSTDTPLLHCSDTPDNATSMKVS